MNKKLKVTIAALSIIALLLALCACSSKAFICGVCNEEKTGKSYKSQLMGEEITICEDCYKEMNDFLGN